MKNSGCLIDLHLHLDGAISLKSARALAALQGISVPQSDEKLVSLIRVSPDCRNLNEFLEKFAFPCSLLQTSEGIENAVKNLLSELFEQGVMYAEIRFAPLLSANGNFTQRDAVKAALEGAENSRIPCNFILCCMRGEGLYEKNIETVDAAAEFLGMGVCAADLAGAEALYPTKDFADVFAYAKSKNVPFTIHAGEADGAESIKAALSFGAVRIGHGIRCTEDGNLIKYLAENKIPLELCPTSNICTCVYKSLAEYPIKRLMDAGVIVTVNTDDPAIEGTDLYTEYEKLLAAEAIGSEDVAKLLKNSVYASFASDELKNKMLEKIKEQYPDADC